MKVWVRKSRILPILALIVVALCVVCSLFGLLIEEQEKTIPEHLPTPVNTPTMITTSTAMLANTPTAIPTMTLTPMPTETLALAPTEIFTKVPVIQPTIVSQVCCVRCSKGKACGDSCIDKDLTCEMEPGCACDTE